MAVRVRAVWATRRHVMVMYARAVYARVAGVKVVRRMTRGTSSANVGAQAVAPQSAESMASLLASAWGASAPTTGAQVGEKAQPATGAQVGGRSSAVSASGARTGEEERVVQPPCRVRAGVRGGSEAATGSLQVGALELEALKPQAPAGAQVGVGPVAGAQVRAEAKRSVAATTDARVAATGGVKAAVLGVPTGDANVSRAGAGLVSSAAAADAPLHRQWDFGDVPEHREVERNRLRLVVYPAIEDRVTGVALVEARNAPAAEAISRAGIVRLAMLALPPAGQVRRASA